MKLGEICRSISETFHRSLKSLVLINTSDVFDGKVTNHTYVPNNNLRGQFKKSFQEGDILYSEIRPKNRRFAFVDFDASNYVASTKLMVLRANEHVLPEFLFQLLKSEKIVDQLQTLAETRSGTFPQITFSELASLEAPIPVLEEQRTIATTLKMFDEKIENNSRINHHLEQMAQAIFKSWFVDFEPFGGKMPNNWQKKDIYSIADIIYGAPFASKLFNTDGNGKPIIRIRDLKEQRFVTYTPEIHPKGRLIQAGDIIVGMDGEFRPYIWGNDEAWLNQRVCIFSNKRSKGKAFLYCLIKPLLFAIEQTQVATTVIHIGKKDFDAFSIFLPDDETLTAFDNVTDPMIWQIVHNSQENKRLTELRDTLLPRLMSGELSVADLDGGK